MPRIFLISPEEIKAGSPIENNVDNSLIAKTISDVQAIHLEPILGSALYIDFLSAVSDSRYSGITLNAAYTALLPYIKDYILNKAVADFLVPVQYKITAKGLMKMSDDSSTNISDSDLQTVKDHYDNLAITFKKNLIDYLADNDLVVSSEVDTSITDEGTGWLLDDECSTSYGGSGGGDGSSSGGQGVQGPAGAQGPQGNNGNNGNNGQDGRDGLDGIYVLNVQNFGAIGDGVIDDTTAIEAAVASATTLGGAIIYLPAGTYKIRRSIKLPSYTELRGAGMGLTKITKGATVRSALASNASLSASSVTVVDASAFSVGDAFHAADTSNFEWASTQGVITDITGNIITFDNPLDANILTTRSAFVSTSFPMVINENASRNIRVCHLTLDQNANANDPSDEFTISTIHWAETYDSVVENVEILNSASDAYSDQAQEGLGLTPTFAAIKTTKNYFRNNVIDTSGRHGVHLGTCMNGAFVTNNKIVNCVNMALFYCAYVTNTVASNNLIESCGKGFASGDDRDSGNIIDGNIFKDCGSLGWTIEPGPNTAITGNNLKNCTRGILIAHPNCQLSNNNVEMTAGNEAIRITTLADRTTINGGIISGATSIVVGSTGLYIDSADDVKITNLTISGFYKGADIRGVNRLGVVNSPIHNISINQGWILQVGASTDISLDLKGCTVLTPVFESVAPVRALYNGLGTNGAANPNVSGDWFVGSASTANKKYDGAMVQWNDGVEHISIFKQGVGWKEMILPQDLGTASTPTFSAATISGRVVINSTGINSVSTAITSSQLYASGTGPNGNYPFDQNGNLVIQPRTTSADRDIVFITSSNPATPSMVINREGHVGIGVSGSADVEKPQGWLHIRRGSTDFYGAPLIFTISGASLTTTPRAGAMEVDSTSIYYTNNSGVRNPFVIGTAITITTAGLVGVNNLSPTQQLDVSGKTRITNSLLIGTAGATTRKLSIDNITGAIAAQASFNDAGGTVRLAMGVNASDDFLMAASGSLRLYGGSTLGSIVTNPTNERMVIHSNGGVGIGLVSGGTPNSVAILELSSTTKGVLFPRMTTVQRNAITPVEGLVVYDLTTHSMWYYNATTWIEM